MLPGRYLVGFQHPRLDSLGFDAVTRVVKVPVGSASTELDLALPGAQTLAASFCGVRADTTGVIVGRVRRADTGALEGGGVVEVTWGEMLLDAAGLRPTRARVRSPVGVDGRFTVCGVPTNVPVLLRASAVDSVSPATSGSIELSFADGAPLLHRDLYLGAAMRDTSSLVGAMDDSLGTSRARPRGSASITGRVIAPGGRPVPGARVRVPDLRVSDAYVTTDSAGRFRMSSLPAGTFPVEAIAIGFTPTSASVDLRPGSTTPLTIALQARVTSLDAVTVYSVRSRAAIGFEKRRLQKRGYFLTGDSFATHSVRASSSGHVRCCRSWSGAQRVLQHATATRQWPIP